MASAHLPPFPDKHVKFFTDHFNPHFIHARKVLLHNYVKQLRRHRQWRGSRPFRNFVVPGAHALYPAVSATKSGKAEPEDVFEPRPDDAPSAATDERKEKKTEDGNASAKEEPSDEEIMGLDDLLDQVGRDPYDRALRMEGDAPLEFTDVSVPSAQPLRGDHVIYQVGSCR